MNDKALDPGNIINTIIEVVINPVAFFHKMQKSGGYTEPLIIVLASGVLYAVIAALYGVLGLGAYGAFGTFAIGFAGIILIPLYLVIGSFIGGAIYYVIVRLMGSKENYEVAYRCVAYSSAIYPLLAILTAVPYAGSLVQAVWPMVLLAIASIQVHAIKEKVAWTVFGILGIIFAISVVSTEYAARHITNDLYNLKYNLELHNKYKN